MNNLDLHNGVCSGDSAVLTRVFSIPPQHVGLVVGRNGVHANSLRKTRGVVALHVDKFKAEVRVWGSQEGIANVERSVTRLLAKVQRKDIPIANGNAQWNGQNAKGNSDCGASEDGSEGGWNDLLDEIHHRLLKVLWRMREVESLSQLEYHADGALREMYVSFLGNGSGMPAMELTRLERNKVFSSLRLIHDTLDEAMRRPDFKVQNSPLRFNLALDCLGVHTTCGGCKFFKAPQHRLVEEWYQAVNPAFSSPVSCVVEQSPSMDGSSVLGCTQSTQGSESNESMFGRFAPNSLKDFKLEPHDEDIDADFVRRVVNGAVDSVGDDWGDDNSDMRSRSGSDSSTQRTQIQHSSAAQPLILPPPQQPLNSLHRVGGGCYSAHNAISLIAPRSLEQVANGHNHMNATFAPPQFDCIGCGGHCRCIKNYKQVSDSPLFGADLQATHPNVSSAHQQPGQFGQRARGDNFAMHTFGGHSAYVVPMSNGAANGWHGRQSPLSFGAFNAGERRGVSPRMAPAPPSAVDAPVLGMGAAAF